jgi:WhiB family redox-sensing transcriptional regulator
MIRLDTGACRDSDLDLFHPASHNHEAIDAARAICGRCPIRLDCLALALTNPDAPGIWGGLTHEQRAGIRSTGIGVDLAQAELCERRVDQPVSCDGLSTEVNECAVDDLPTRLLDHLYASGLTLTTVVGCVDDEVADRIREVIHELDDAIRDIHRTAVASIIEGRTEQS